VLTDQNGENDHTGNERDAVVNRHALEGATHLAAKGEVSYAQI
jgi:hypothetical protein